MGLRVTGVSRVIPGRVSKEKTLGDGTKVQKGIEEWGYPVYLPFMGGQLYASCADAQVHTKCVDFARGNRDGVDLLCTFELGKFKEDTTLKLIDVEIPGGVNPGSPPGRGR